MKSAGISPAVFVIIYIVGIAVCLSVLSVLIAITGNKLPQLPYVVRQKFQEDSVNRWFLSTFKMAWFIAIFSAAIQLFIAYIFLRAGDSTYGQNLYIYSMSCPDSRTWCSSQKKTSYTGWITFVVVVAIFLLRDFFSGFLLFYESSVSINMRGTIAAIILLIITTLSCGELSCSYSIVKISFFYSCICNFSLCNQHIKHCYCAGCCYCFISE